MDLNLVGGWYSHHSENDGVKVSWGDEIPN